MRFGENKVLTLGERQQLREVLAIAETMRIASSDASQAQSWPSDYDARSSA